MYDRGLWTAYFWEVFIMTYRNSHSLDVFYSLGDVARKYNISSKEVEETILRWALRKIGGVPKCEHLPEDVIARRDGSRAHCKRCWTWMEVISRPGANY